MEEKRDYNLDDEVLRLIKRYRSEISRDDVSPQEDAISVTTAKRRIVEKVRSGNIPTYVAGRALDVIVRMEKYYRPGSDMSLQDMFDESYKAKIRMQRGNIKKHSTIQEKMTADGIALQEYIRERRIAYYVDGDKEKRVLYSMYDILEIDNDCVEKYEEFVRKYSYVENKFVIDESLNDFIVNKKDNKICAEQINAPGIEKLGIAKEKVVYLKEEDKDDINEIV